jgi:hypothetical protein
MDCLFLLNWFALHFLRCEKMKLQNPNCGIDQIGEPTMANMAGPALPGICGLKSTKIYADDNKKIQSV